MPNGELEQEVALWCSRCKRHRPTTEFPKNRAAKGRGGFARWCKTCWAQYRDGHGYGADPVVLARLLEVQGGACAICQEPETTKGGRNGNSTMRLSLDHGPGGEVRGLLCFMCNKALGHIRERPELLDRMKEYLLSCPPTVNSTNGG
jgi:hypothetical protein